MSASETIISTRTSVVVCVILVVLTIVNIVLAQIDLRGWNTGVGLVIATLQAAISATFFMHLRWSRPIVLLVGVVGLMWLSILIVGTMDDVLTRGWLPIPGK